MSRGQKLPLPVLLGSFENAVFLVLSDNFCSNQDLFWYFVIIHITVEYSNSKANDSFFCRKQTVTVIQLQVNFVMLYLIMNFVIFIAFQLTHHCWNSLISNSSQKWLLAILLICSFLLQTICSIKSRCYVC